MIDDARATVAHRDWNAGRTEYDPSKYENAHCLPTEFVNFLFLHVALDYF